MRCQDMDSGNNQRICLLLLTLLENKTRKFRRELPALARKCHWKSPGLSQYFIFFSRIVPILYVNAHVNENVSRHVNGNVFRNENTDVSREPNWRYTTILQQKMEEHVNEHVSREANFKYTRILQKKMKENGRK